MNGQRERELTGIIEKQILRMDALYTSISDAFDRDVALLGRTGNAGFTPRPTED